VSRLARILALCLLALAAVGAAGCGNKEEIRTEGETEGLYIDVDDLLYQIQLSRILNPASPEDSAYLIGLPEGEEPAADEVWFGIWLRVQNITDETHQSADRFEMVDSTHRSYQPTVLDRRINVFQHEPGPVGPGVIVPRDNSPAADGPIQGDLLLFKVNVQSLFNRPVEFRISRNGGTTTGIVDLDI
jgi:hypothetical protein